jgi:hypothetical protein
MHTPHRGWKASFTRGIEISNTDPALIAATMSALSLLGIHATVFDGCERRPGHRPVSKVRVHQRENLERFLELVPFRSPAKRTKLTASLESYQTHYRRIADVRDELERLYITEQRSIDEIARHFECSGVTVHRWLRKAGIGPARYAIENGKRIA